MRMQLLLACGFCLMTVGRLTADEAPVKADPREKLETAIPELRRLVKAEDYANLVRKFIPPKNLERMTREKPLEEFLKDEMFMASFKKRGLPMLQGFLDAVKDTRPELSKDGKTATYRYSYTGVDPRSGDDAKPELLKRKAIFVKVGKLWYLEDVGRRDENGIQEKGEAPSPATPASKPE